MMARVSLIEKGLIMRPGSFNTRRRYYDKPRIIAFIVYNRNLVMTTSDLSAAGDVIIADEQRRRLLNFWLP